MSQLQPENQSQSSAREKLLIRFKSLPKFMRVSAYILTAYAMYALLLGLVIPAILQAKLPEKLTEMTGRETKIGEIRINPFLLRAQVNDFSLAEADPAMNFVAFKQLEVEVSFWQSLLHFTPTLDHFLLQKPVVSVARLASTDAATFNFSDIVEHLASTDSESAAITSQDELSGETIPAVQARKISIDQGQLHFTDEITGTNLSYTALNLSLDQLNSRALTLHLAEGTAQQTEPLNTAANHYALSVTGRDKGLLELNGQFQLQPLEVQGNVAVSHFTLLPFWPLSEQMIMAQLADGEVNVSSAYRIFEQDQQIAVTTEQGELSLSNLQFNDGETPKVKLPLLKINDIVLDSNRRTLSVADIKMSGLWVDAAFDEKGVDLQSLFTPAVTASSADDASAESQTDEPTTNETADTAPWLVQLGQFALADSDINLLESQLTRGVHWRISPLNIVTGGVRSDLSQPIDYKLDFAVSSSLRSQPEKARGEFSSQGSVDVQSQSVSGSLNLSALDLSQLQPYLEQSLNVQLEQGSVSSRGEFSADGQGQVLYSGQASLDQLLIKDGLAHEPLLQWKQMAIDGLQFDLAKNALNIEQISFDKPYAKVLIAKDRHTNIGEIVRQNGQADQQAKSPLSAEPQSGQQIATSGKQATQADSSMKLDIGRVKIVDGSAYFADYSLTPNFASGIESLQGYIDHLSSTPGTKAKIDLKGMVDKYAPLTLSGEVNPLIDPPYLDLDFVLNSAELTSVNPYSGTYVGYYIDKGQLSLNVNYLLENNQLKGSNHVLVDQLTLGKASNSDLATNLPISLAIALLQDSKGVIDLGVDISGDINNPDFSFGSIIVKALGNIITKAVTAPFSLLANLIGSDEELDRVQFVPGSAELSPEEQKRLNKLAKALQDRPKLSVSVVGAIDPQQDGHQLAQAHLLRKLQQMSGVEPLPQDLTASRIPESGPIVNALENLFVQELSKDLAQERDKVEQQLMDQNKTELVDPAELTSVLHIGMYNQLLNAQDITDTDLGNLADARAKSVKAYLINSTQMEPGRIFVMNSMSKLKTEGSEVQLTLDAK